MKLLQKIAENIYQDVDKNITYYGKPFRVYDYIYENDLFVKKDKVFLSNILNNIKDKNSNLFCQKNSNVINRIIGLVMRETRGTACPKIVKELVVELINE